MPLSSAHQQPPGFQLQNINHPAQNTGSGSSQLPPAYNQGSVWGQPASGRGIAPATVPVSQTTSTRLQSRFLEIYYCVDKPWSERSITLVRPLPVNDSLQDIEFCRQLLEDYYAVRGFRGRWFSWKTCVDVKFINVSFRMLIFQHVLTPDLVLTSLHSAR
jgi:hypothetical protein